MILSTNNPVSECGLNIKLEEVNPTEKIVEHVSKLQHDLIEEIKEYYYLKIHSKSDAGILDETKLRMNNILTYNIQKLGCEIDTLSRFAKNKIRKVHNNPILDSFKELMNKDLSKYDEDLLNKAYDIPTKYLNGKAFNILIQMNEDNFYNQLKELANTHELANYYSTVLDQNDTLSTVTLRDASILYSRLMEYYTQINTIIRIFNKMLVQASDEMHAKINAGDFIELINEYANGFGAVLQFIHKIYTIITRDFDTLEEIIEDVVIKAEQDIYNLNKQQEEQQKAAPKEYKPPIW